MLLTTFKRDGSPVATPVHVIVNGDRAYFRTWDPNGKSKRLRHTARVEVTPCSLLGHTIGPTLRACAQRLDGQAARHAARALAHRFPVLHGAVIPIFHRIRGWSTVQYELRPPASTGAEEEG